MILALIVRPGSTTALLATPAGELTATRDASWRVGSGQSLATHVAGLLVDAGCAIDDLTRIALIDQGGSYTSARTAYAFAQTLSFARQLPIVLRHGQTSDQLNDALRSVADQLPSAEPIVPRYTQS